MVGCSETIKARRRYICPSIYLRAWTRKEGETAGTKEKDTPTRYGPGHGRVVLQQRKRVHIDLYIDTHVPEYNICARISTLGLTWGDSGIREGGFNPPLWYKFVCTREISSCTNQIQSFDLYLRKSPWYK